MGQQTGVVQIKSRVGNLVFSKGSGVSIAPPSNKSSFDSAASMVWVRENASEFGLAGQYGKLLRGALRVQIQAASDRYMVSRFTKKMLEIIKLDDVNDRGQRQYDSSNAAPLLGFNFNEGAGLLPFPVGAVEAWAIITYQKAGTSYHNHLPSWAIDVALLQADGSVKWDAGALLLF